jgi:hypothetical protein
MPIRYFQLTRGNSSGAGYEVARNLAEATIGHFGAVRGAGAGIAAGSCCAALAVQSATQSGYSDLENQPHSGVFGNSRFASGLVMGPVGGHAERAALTAAGNDGLSLYLLPGSSDAVLFVELEPCRDCKNWLEGNGGGVPNPFANQLGASGNVTLNVWYIWPYPAGVKSMGDFHTRSLSAQEAVIAAL